MGTSARIRKQLDYGRLRRAMAGPGADPRTWCATARVDDDPDAIRFEEPDGWLVDVTIQGGPLDGEEITCRVASGFAQNGATRSDPPSRDCEVLVVISEGDPNANPVIVGQVHNGGGCPVPSSVNGEGLDEQKALATHVLVTPHDVDQQIGGFLRQFLGEDLTQEADGNVKIQAKGAQAELLAALVNLADAGATQSYVRGTVFAAALQSVLFTIALESTTAAAAATALAAVPLLAPAVPALTAWGVAATANATSVNLLIPRLVPGDLLSLKIFGE